MAQKTFKELVNAVLVELREDQVGSVSSSAYSALIGRFVNTAKTIVEDAWDWAALRTAIGFNSDGTNRVFDLSTGSSLSHTGGLTNERSKLLVDPETERPMAIDTTANAQAQLYDYPLDIIIRRVNIGQTASVGIPSDFGLNNVADGFEVIFDYIPPSGRSYVFWFYVPQDDLSSDSDTLTIPWRPVVALAANIARHERGEEVGEPNTIGDAVYRQLLSDAVALDSFNRRTIYNFTPN